jgi:predicted RNA-binding protein with PIN domain
MARPDRDPLAATRRLLIDGSNLLHALSRTSSAAPPAALIGRLRGAIPATTGIEIVFDGPPERGLRNERIASGVTVRYSGGRTADAVILTLIDDVHLLDGSDGTVELLVVTDDRDLRHRSRLRGARTAGSAWLLGRLDAGRLSSPSVGNPRPARGPRPVASSPQADGDPAEADRPGWKPGRGATTKRGNPRRAPKGAGKTGGQTGGHSGGHSGGKTGGQTGGHSGGQSGGTGRMPP